jgi:hypothetical protein
MFKKLLLAATASLAFAGAANAATDGSLSSTSSSGSFNVTANIPALVQVSGLSDQTINVTVADLTNQYFSTVDTVQKFCVYSNNGADGDYSVSVSGLAGKVAPYALVGATALSPQLGMYVWVSDDPNNALAGGGKGYSYNGDVHTGYKTTTGGGARPTTVNCGGNPDASLDVRLNVADILAVTEGTYKGTLTVTVSPT